MPWSCRSSDTMIDQLIFFIRKDDDPPSRVRRYRKERWFHVVMDFGFLDVSFLTADLSENAEVQLSFRQTSYYPKFGTVF